MTEQPASHQFIRHLPAGGVLRLRRPDDYQLPAPADRPPRLSQVLARMDRDFLRPAPIRPMFSGNQWKESPHPVDANH